MAKWRICVLVISTHFLLVARESKAPTEERRSRSSKFAHRFAQIFTDLYIKKKTNYHKFPLIFSPADIADLAEYASRRNL